MNATILIVDDDDSVREAMKAVIEAAGCRTETARSADEAIRLVRHFPTRFAAAFVDYRLSEDSPSPDQLGDYVTKRIKEINPRIDVTIVSGDLSTTAFRSWISCGVDRYLYKPVDNEKILTILDCIIAHHAAKSTVLAIRLPYDEHRII